MAMRLRRISGTLVALCAAKTPSQAWDFYLDDEMDHAVRQKIAGDLKKQGIGIVLDYHPKAVAAGAP